MAVRDISTDISDRYIDKIYLTIYRLDVNTKIRFIQRFTAQSSLRIPVAVRVDVNTVFTGHTQAATVGDLESAIATAKAQAAAS